MTVDVSIIIPVKNRAGLISRAIESAVNQSGKFSFEILVIDDGSTDGTVEEVMRHCIVDSRISLLNNRLKPGAPGARNTGIEAAKGEYICLLDSDDEFIDDKIRKQLELMRSEKDIIGCFTKFIYKYPGLPNPVIPKSIEFSQADLCYSNVLGGCSSAMLRTNALRDCGGFDLNMPSCQDWELWFRLSLLGKLVRIDESLTVYHFDSEVRISKNPNNVILGHQMMQTKIIEAVSDLEGDVKLERAFKLRMAEIYSSHIYDVRKALLNAIQAFSYRSPFSSAFNISRIAYRLFRQSKKRA